MAKLMDVQRVMTELPRQIKRTRAKMVAELITEGKSTSEAKRISDATHRRVYKNWLCDFSEEHYHRPGLIDAAERTLKRIGVL